MATDAKPKEVGWRKKYPMYQEGPLDGWCPGCHEHVTVEFRKTKYPGDDGDPRNVGEGTCPKCQELILHRRRSGLYDWFLEKDDVTKFSFGIRPNW